MNRRDKWTTRLRTIFLGVVLLPLLIPFALLAILVILITRLAVHLLVCMFWMPSGKDILFIYSDSPIWHDYMLNEVLPLLAERAVVLNWSQKKSWSRRSLATWAFSVVSGRKNFNPMVVLYRPLKRAHVFRFWAAFQENKHGSAASLNRLTAELRLVL